MVKSSDFGSTDLAGVDTLLLRGIGRDVGGRALRVGVAVLLVKVG